MGFEIRNEKNWRGVLVVSLAASYSMTRKSLLVASIRLMMSVEYGMLEDRSARGRFKWAKTTLITRHLTLHNDQITGTLLCIIEFESITYELQVQYGFQESDGNRDRQRDL